MLWALVMLQPLVATTAGVHELTLPRQDAADIVYTVSIPNDYEPDTARPLVIALHYGGINHQHFGRGVLTGLVEPGLRSMSAIIAAPDSPRGGWSDENAEAIVIDLLDFLVETYRIDPTRIVITGFSMGGMGTWYIAARNPDRFTAAIPVAGAPRNVSDDELLGLAGMPLYAIHSLADTVVPIGPTEQAVATLRAEKAEHIELEIVDVVTHYNVAGFVPYLRQAAVWLTGVWADQ